MLGFSIMMWFVSAILIFVSISLLKGNYSFVHGKVFDTTDNKKRICKRIRKTCFIRRDWYFSIWGNCDYSKKSFYSYRSFFLGNYSWYCWTMATQNTKKLPKILVYKFIFICKAVGLRIDCFFLT